MYLMAGEVWKEDDPFSGDPVAIQTIFFGCTRMRLRVLITSHYCLSN